MSPDEFLKVVIACSTFLALVGTMMMIHGNKKTAQ